VDAGTRAAATCSTAIRDSLLGPTRSAHVAASGTSAVYLTVDGPGNDVIAIVGPRAVRVPIALQVALLPPAAPLSAATVGQGRLRVAGLEFRPVRWWNPRPSVSPEALVDVGPDLLCVVLERPFERFGVPVDLAVDTVIGVADGDADAARRLLGLGPGFTPAGDDVLAGALAALALTGRLDPAVAAGIEDAAVDRTTAFSAALLRCASRGQMIPAAADLVTAAVRGDEQHTATAVAALSAVGSTSGSALALGLAAGLAAIRTSVKELS
jgi:hypothetical protein